MPMRAIAMTFTPTSITQRHEPQSISPTSATSSPAQIILARHGLPRQDLLGHSGRSRPVGRKTTTSPPPYEGGTPSPRGRRRRAPAKQGRPARDAPSTHHRADGQQRSGRSHRTVPVDHVSTNYQSHNHVPRPVRIGRRMRPAPDGREHDAAQVTKVRAHRLQLGLRPASAPRSSAQAQREQARASAPRGTWDELAGGTHHRRARNQTTAKATSSADRPRIAGSQQRFVSLVTATSS